ncbi:MAG: pantetheine-phosphate adenylyltransferase [Oscillospiraceae bacterium]|nr:pantetheine-phosphate adenylyltransferase [Oscillospiraceae bacterium]
MRIAVYPGSFDPVTRGHFDIIERASRLFDRLVVVVLVNPDKRPVFSAEERVLFIERITAGIENVEVDSFDGLLADYFKEKGATAVVKGLRAMSDFEYEFQMALINKQINPEMETLFLNTSGEYMYLSSSIVRQLASFGGDVSSFIPAEIRDEIVERLRKAGE